MSDDRLYSVGEVSKELDLPYKLLCRWVRDMGLGMKVGGWTVVLTEKDREVLSRRAAAGKWTRWAA